MTVIKSLRVYEVCPRRNHRGVDLISDALPFGRFWFTGSNAASRAIECAVATPTPTQER
jgi:hypothetical protein